MAVPIGTKANKDKNAEQASGRVQDQTRPSGPTALHAEILGLQRTAGNRAVNGALQADSANFWTDRNRLTISQPGDKYEQEADRITDQIMRSSDSEVGNKSSSGKPMQTRLVQSDTSSGDMSTVTPDVQAKIEGLQRSGGEPLPENVRSSMAVQFGQDFRHVRIHTGSDANHITHHLEAYAITFGNHVAFGAGQFRPNTTAGKYVLAHELAHIKSSFALNSAAPAYNVVYRLAKNRNNKPKGKKNPGTVWISWPENIESLQEVLSRWATNKFEAVDKKRGEEFARILLNDPSIRVFFPGSKELNSEIIEKWRKEGGFAIRLDLIEKTMEKVFKKNQAENIKRSIEESFSSNTRSVIARPAGVSGRSSFVAAGEIEITNDTTTSLLKKKISDKISARLRLNLPDVPPNVLSMAESELTFPVPKIGSDIQKIVVYVDIGKFKNLLITKYQIDENDLGQEEGFLFTIKIPIEDAETAENAKVGFEIGEAMFSGGVGGITKSGGKKALKAGKKFARKKLSKKTKKEAKNKAIKGAKNKAKKTGRDEKGRFTGEGPPAGKGFEKKLFNKISKRYKHSEDQIKVCANKRFSRLCINADVIAAKNDTALRQGKIDLFEAKDFTPKGRIRQQNAIEAIEKYGGIVKSDKSKIFPRGTVVKKTRVKVVTPDDIGAME